MSSHKVTIRPFRLCNSKSIARHADNINVWNDTRDYLPNPYTEQDAVSFITAVTSNDSTTDFVIDVDGEAVGAIGFIPQSDVQRFSAEIGYWLGEEFWNRGIATEALRFTVDHIFRETDMIHLFASTFGGNTASMRVLEKGGFRKVGVMHNAAVKNGRLVDMHYYEKVKDF